jgi:cytochrome b
MPKPSPKLPMPKLANSKPPVSTQASVGGLRVWDICIRVFHWSLATSFAAAWFTAEGRDGLHQLAGLTAATLIGLRLIWGFIGTPYARFSQFVRSPGNIYAYLRSILTGSEARFIGHNPAGGAMVIALLMTLSATAFTGWLMTTDAYFGDETMQAVHSRIADGMLVLVALHLGGVILASIRHRENLVVAMVTGQKRPASPNDIS